MRKVDNIATEDYGKKQNNFVEMLRRLRKNKGAVFGIAVIIFLILSAIVSAFAFDYVSQVCGMNIKYRFSSPSLQFLFGTDDMGRNLFVRILYGARYSLIIGFGSVAITAFVGLILGGLAGFYGGLVDDIIMRICDILASIPSILLGMCIMTVFGQSLPNLLIAVGIPSIPSFARIARSSVMTVKGAEYVEAAKSIGMSDFRIIFTQVIPNGLSPIIVTITTNLGTAINTGAALSFLGFGVPAPTPEWGAIIAAGRNFISTAPWITTIPGVFIFITVLSFNLVGDGLRDALDPKLKK